MSGPNELMPAQFLAVTNHSVERIEAGFHGEHYEWASGETLNLSQDAARHIFGFGLEDKTAAFHRLGWLNTRPDGTPKDAQMRLSRIGFSPVKQVFEIGEAPKRGRPRGSGSDRSLATVGISAGDSQESPTQTAQDA